MTARNRGGESGKRKRSQSRSKIRRMSRRMNFTDVEYKEIKKEKMKEEAG